MKQIRLITVFSVILIAFAFSYAFSKDFDDAVKDLNKEFTDAVSRHDSIAIAGMYHSDARLLPPNAEMVKGRDAIGDFWKDMLTPSITEMVLESEDTEKEDDLGVETGTYEIKGEKDVTLDKGKYVVVWKKDGGKWRIYRDIWNSSLPAAPPPVQ